MSHAVFPGIVLAWILGVTSGYRGIRRRSILCGWRRDT
nr:hypothetical protein [Escherichia coli]